MSVHQLNGFTLIESLIGLIAMSGFFLVSSLIINQLVGLDRYLQKDDLKNWTIFLGQLTDALSIGERIDVEGQRLIYYVDEQLFMIEQYQQMVRRRRSTGGHQPMLMNVHLIQFVACEREIILEVEFLNGKMAYAKWVRPD